MDSLIVKVMVVFLIIGAVDKLLGNRFGYGQRFEDGFRAMGPLVISMAGLLSLSPVLANLIAPVAAPLLALIGADPSVAAASVLAIDMGGYPLAVELAQHPDAGQFSGVLLGTMMGATLSFTIPVALGILRREDREPLATGILIGLSTIPIGCLIGGVVAGFAWKMMLLNLVPVTLFAALIVFGLWKRPAKMVACFLVFGRIIEIVALIGLVLAILSALLGIELIDGLKPLSEGLLLAGKIAVILAGAFPLVHFLTTVFRKPLLLIGSRLRIGETSTAGLITSLANCLPMFAMLHAMDRRGKILNISFAVSGAFVFGGQFAFVAGVSPEMLVPMIAGKLGGGVAALLVAMWFLRGMREGEQEGEKAGGKST